VKADVFKISTSGPADISTLVRLMDEGKIVASEVVCIIGKTEGNGGRNDFTRDLAMTAFEELFSQRLGISRKEVTDRIIFSLSGGCEGVVSPHICVFTASGALPAVPAKEKRLTIGIGFTRAFKPEEIGRMAQVEETAAAIKKVIETLKVDSLSDVHFVQMKGAIPNYTFEQGRAAAKAGKPMRSDMIYSRGASALAAALAVGEVKLADLSDDDICSDWSKFSSTSSCSAKPGLERTEIMVMANSPYWEGDITINHGILNDMIDSVSVHQVLRGLGIYADVQCTQEQSQRIVGVFGKSEADPRGTIRGRRHTMLTDDDISDTRYSRGVLAAVIASIIGDTTIYISTRAEHHGPLGGGTLAILARQA
jgi:cyanuric acid amidohydrolase